MTAFDPGDFLAVARRLLQERDEASARSSASRAYYGVFLIARRLAGLRNRSSEVHRLTAEYFLKQGDRSIAMELESLRHRRNDADYEIDWQFSRRDSEAILRRSLQLQEALRAAAGRAKYRGLNAESNR
ncbi:hypothetical protein [Roseateles sp.]|uniref:hypothetical protein n=1 Tax=Roseateles sp. TaxID=1971397 RepID=UPI0031E3C8E4